MTTEPRDKDEGAGVFAAFSAHMRLSGAAHGTPFEGRDCVACNALKDALSAWVAAHEATP